MTLAPAVQSFNPPERMLMGPGPSDVHPRVTAAMARPTIGHLDPRFSDMMEEAKEMLRYMFRTKNALTIPVSAPGSAGMETCFVNLVEPGETVVIGANGVFAGRMRENVERIGATAVMVESEWGKPVNVAAVREALESHPEASLLAFVHAETSTGVRSDAQALAALGREHGCLVIADCVTTMTGIDFRMDEWGIDAVYTGTQKCLSAPPGLSPISFSERAVAKLQGRSSKVQSWFLDLSLVMGYWSGDGGRSYHHTAPVNAMYGLHEALVMMCEEGLDARIARHRRHHRALVAGLAAMGLGMLVDEADRLPQLNTVLVPHGIDEAAVRAQLMADFGLEIGAGLGPLAGKVWRIGLMGESASKRHVMTCIAGLESVLSGMQASINQGAALPAVSAAYDD